MEDYLGSAMLLVFAIVVIIATIRLTKIENETKQKKSQSDVEAYWRGVEDGRKWQYSKDQWHLSEEKNEQ